MIHPGDDEKRAELAIHRSYTKECRSERRIRIDPNVPPWVREFFNFPHSLKESHEIDLMIAANIAT